MKNFKGYIQVYTGDGKGKTTTAIGLAIRALGAGLKVAFFQFFKPGTSSEVNILKGFSPQLYYKALGKEGFIEEKVDLETKELILKGWEEVKNLVKSETYNIIVLDEITYALNWGLIDLQEFLDFLKNKPENLELIITGRNAPKEVVDLADLVTEMKKVKHYYEKGVKSRKGIEK
ncbi:MAG: cob(I)yrinic acid a,c-diamide adenosyltransferase [Thermodesulfobacterium geofontis]|uniref:corrinoid adenosyltransferase n=1 Tax=Thermodesulfobacterium geofontis TaxID=1295609 RepID=A0A2N7QFY0_9BACT|nr:MAG: cob(I)yrinic acid a,c-diamide adenosyltransferase [Thermodesulfobacterium geofontis]PMP97837.1 MAG: cob(I)yrinic acid a,c-diamide adenosyltransferase [Thermodesulfobacterium geofontis]